MELEIKSFDIESATKSDWALLHDFRRKNSTEAFPGDPIDDDETTEIYTKGALDQFDITTVIVTEKENPNIAVAGLVMFLYKPDSPSYIGNEHLLRLGSFSVLKDYRRKEIGFQLLKCLKKYAAKHGKTSIVGSTTEEDGRDVLKKLGGKEALEMRDNRTNLEEIDWDMIDSWVRESEQKSPDSTLEFYTSIPDSILDDYCKVYTEVYNQMPFDQLDVGKKIFTPAEWKREEERVASCGETWLTAITREKSGEISGLTDVIYVPSMTPLLYQMLTGVPDKYRGTKKGKWLKAAMLKKIKQDYPDVQTISTVTATSNAPMISINERLGFKIHREIFAVQIETEKLGKFLEAR